MTKKIFITWLIILGITGISSGQKGKDKFELELPAYKVANSLYDSIEFVDSRYDDQEYFGTMIRENTKPVNFKMPASEKMQQMILQMIDSSAHKGTALLQLRNLKIIDVGSKGLIHFDAVMYAKVNSLYYKINAIDTVVAMSGLDASKRLLKKTGVLFHGFIAESITKPAGSLEGYSYKEVNVMDSTEKSKIAIYNTEHYNDGIYYNYLSFFNNKPDEMALRVDCKKKTQDIVTVYVNNNGKELKLSPDTDLYVVVNGGKPYIATRFGYYELYKIDDDFHFTAKDRIKPTAADISVASVTMGVMSGLTGGIVAGLLMAVPDNGLFEFRINHRTGNADILNFIKDYSKEVY